MTSSLELKQINVSIAGQSICTDFDVTFAGTHCWGILGKNGSGKTTLLHTIAGLRAADAGEILFDHKSKDSYSKRAWARHVGILFQEHQDNFPSTVLETALMGRHPYIGRWQWESQQDISLAKAALNSVGLSGKEQQYIDTLSGGERRRLAIATLLTQSPDIMLLDEPTNHLDLHYQMTLLNTLTNITTEQSKCMVMVMHDVNMAARFCDHIIILHNNGSTMSGTTDELAFRRSV
jgi:iron complex transport system ATP-binding protein